MLQPAIKCVFILQADSEAVIFVTLLLSRQLRLVFLLISNLTDCNRALIQVQPSSRVGSRSPSDNVGMQMMTLV